MEEHLNPSQFTKTSEVFPRTKLKDYPVPQAEIPEGAEPTDIPTNRLVATQSVVNTGVAGSSDPIVVTQQRGWYYVGDGHHRATTALLNGDESISAHILPTSKARAKRY